MSDADLLFKALADESKLIGAVSDEWPKVISKPEVADRERSDRADAEVSGRQAPAQLDVA